MCGGGENAASLHKEEQAEQVGARDILLDRQRHLQLRRRRHVAVAASAGRDQRCEDGSEQQMP
jgi:hypothetical protein